MTGRLPFSQLLRNRWDEGNTLVCVGLDPEPDRFPESMRRDPVRARDFLGAIIDATAAHACAFKPQIAHFAALSAEAELADLIRYVHERYPEVPVILDAKRGDIGSTAERYAAEVFLRYGADAATVNPYTGWEGVAPFLEYADRGVIVLCRTSNPGSDWLQQHPQTDPTYLRVAAAAVEWNVSGNVGLVAGATYPEDIGRIRSIAPDLPLLVPGIGAQGGDLAAVLGCGLDSQGAGLMLSSSRGILYGDSEAPESGWAERAGRAAETLKEAINRLRRAPGAG